MQIGFYIVFLVGVTVLFYFVAAPYISAIFLAIITAVVTKSLYLRILKSLHGRKNIASFITVLIVMVSISLPLVVVGNLLIKESGNFYVDTQSQGPANQSLEQVGTQIEDSIESHVPGLDLKLDRFLNVGHYAEQVFIWITGNLAAFFSGILRLTLSALLYVLCLFYLFRDGDALVKNVLVWSPLFDVYDSLILKKIGTAVKSVILGQLMVALLQGLLTGLGFWIFGVSNPVIWGTVAAVASLVPAIGTSLVNIPGVLYLLFVGHTMPAIGLLVWAAVAVGLIDNIIGPYVINRGVQVHPFLILISVLGGIGFFGPIGFIAGPVVLSLLFALLELYPVILRAKAADTKE